MLQPTCQRSSPTIFSTIHHFRHRVQKCLSATVCGEQNEKYALAFLLHYSRSVSRPSPVQAIRMQLLKESSKVICSFANSAYLEGSVMIQVMSSVMTQAPAESPCLGSRALRGSTQPPIPSKRFQPNLPEPQLQPEIPSRRS